MENKQNIIKGLEVILKQTHYFARLDRLELDEEQGQVVAVFKNGYRKHANIAGDDGVAMIEDAIRQLTK